MGFVILGLLLNANMTSYDLTLFISRNLSIICSSSAGSIQTALKKLLKDGYITFSKVKNGSIEKKVYKITDSGALYFKEQLSKPMQVSKVKNIELAKIFFLGHLEKSEQIRCLKDYLNQLIFTREILVTINNSAPRTVDLMSDDKYKYNMLMLEYGIDSTTFHIEWYEKQLKKLGE